MPADENPRSRHGKTPFPLGHQGGVGWGKERVCQEISSGKVIYLPPASISQQIQFPDTRILQMPSRFHPDPQEAQPGLSRERIGGCCSSTRHQH